MKIKDSTHILSSIKSLIFLASKHKIINEIEASGYEKLSKNEPILIFGLLCERLYKQDATYLFKERGDVLQTLNVCYPTFSKFIARKTLSNKSSNLGKRLLVIIPMQVVELIDNAYDEKIISIEEKEMYIDIISWDTLNCSDVELDILLKVIDWNYSKFKEKAPNILSYIKNFYPDFFGKLMEPHQQEIKKRVL